MTEALIETISSIIQTDSFVQPTSDTRIYKDECSYCFKTPHWKDGIYISLSSYHCFCREHVFNYAEQTGNKLFIQFQSKKLVHETTDNRNAGEPNSKMTKLSIEGDPKIEFEDKYYIVVHPNYDVRLDSTQKISDSLSSALHTVSTTTSAERLATLSSTSNAWDADIKLITKHANLTQIDNGKKLPYSDWKCEEESCDVKDNLWLCLTDGAIRCGRSQFIAEGKKSSGNGHMQQYYSLKKYPLVVKLGTICAQLDAADVYSYDEDDAVVDPNLDKHLAHFGLDANKMERTVKSTLEMELDINEKWEWSRCQEDGALLEAAFGPGLTGLINTGSSCYMNSVLQAIVQIDSFRKRYSDGAFDIFKNVLLDQLHTDFNGQFAKLLSGMLSDDYSKPDELATNAIKPLNFKRVAAGNHPEFMTAKQQDVEEYIRFLFEKITENTPAGVEDPTDSLRFVTYNRFEDIASKKVRYTEQEELLLHLPIPQNLLTPIEGVDNRYKVEMGKALESFFSPQLVEDYKSPITGEAKGASNTIRLKTFPNFLLIQIQKFAYTSDGQLKKLDLDFEIEENIDLVAYRGNGILENEEKLPEDSPKESPKSVQIPDNVRLVADQLKLMGFSENASIKAAFEGKGSVEIATDWLMSHLDDPTLNDEFQIPNAESKEKNDESNIALIEELGFTKYQAKYSLKQKPNVQEAIDWLFNNINNIPPEPKENPTSSQIKNETKKSFIDGNEKYELIGMITHMGSRPDSGHYVAHMVKNGRWVLFNDEKVAFSQDPPKKLAYIYLYKRI